MRDMPNAERKGQRRRAKTPMKNTEDAPPPFAEAPCSALKLHADNSSYYRDGLGNWAAECPQCYVRMRQDAPRHYVCKKCGKLWELVT